MGDIIAELRSWPARGDGSDGMSAYTVGGIMVAAADEIERLRSTLAECCDYIEGDEIAHGRTYRAGCAARAVLSRQPPAGLE